MSNEIAVHSGGTELAITDAQQNWTAKQVSALAQIGVEHATNADLAVFFHQCARSGLDPFARQIYMIGRKQWDPQTRTETVKQTIQVGIDGFRLIARRAADRRHETLGYEPDQWCGPDGKWVDVWVAAEPPTAARVVVLRNGQPFPAVALFREYCPVKKDGTPQAQWAVKPAHMIQKCCESLALRKAFPQELSGLYTDDEMGGVDVVDAAPDRPAEASQRGVAALRHAAATAHTPLEPEARQGRSEPPPPHDEPPPDEPPPSRARSPRVEHHRNPSEDTAPLETEAEPAADDTAEWLGIIGDLRDAEQLRRLRRDVAARPDATQLAAAITARLRVLS